MRNVSPKRTKDLDKGREKGNGTGKRKTKKRWTESRREGRRGGIKSSPCPGGGSSGSTGPSLLWFAENIPWGGGGGWVQMWSSLVFNSWQASCPRDNGVS